ncbi:hypothetical protein ACFO3J_09865 [Streptomyces polygonati]|uniref:Uncharacterized protein n=1 Tax=Streptomyces polygonati TaxID=1617087 RepID=A0ABV8HN97_9ACTN
MQINQVLDLAVSDSAGPGPVMRSIIVIAVVGGVLIAWFVLRGYRDND